MHFLKLLLETWLVFGVITVVIGMLWTSRLSREKVINEVPAQPKPKRLPEFERALAKARSA